MAHARRAALELAPADGPLPPIAALKSFTGAATALRDAVVLSLLSEPVAVGDYVTLQAGRYVVGRMDAKEAAIRLALFAELLDQEPAVEGTSHDTL